MCPGLHVTLFAAVIAALRATEGGIARGLPDVIRIGVVYDQARSSEEEKLLSQALDRANLNASDAGEASSLPNEGSGAHTKTAVARTPHLSLSVVRLEPEDIFRSSKKVCGLLEQGVLAVLGPEQPDAACLVHSACARHRIPHVYLYRGNEGDRRVFPDSVSLTLTPSPEDLGRALRDLVEAQRWPHFTIVYERSDALARLRGLLQLSMPGGEAVPVSLRLLPSEADPRPLLREMAKAGESNFVLDLTAQRLTEVLRHAQKIGIITEYHNYIVTTLDLHTVELSGFQNSGTNMSGFQLLNKELWEQDLGTVREAYARTGVYPVFLGHRTPRRPIRVAAALAEDALNLLVRAAQNLARARDLGRPPIIRCRDDFVSRAWPQSQTLVQAAQKTPFAGLTGTIWLDRYGRRHNLSLHVVQLKRSGLSSVGTWSAFSGLRITRTEKMFQEEILNTLKNKTFLVTTLLNAPYVMLKESAHKLEGNDRFEGFCVDLLREMAVALGFRYQLRLVRDGSHGSRDSRGHWNGMMRELLDKEADLAIADLTITYAREQVVDFTTPFMTVGVSILYRKPEQEQSLLFFLCPLSTGVWLLVAIAYVAVSLLLFCVSRVETLRWSARCASSGRCCCCGNESRTRAGVCCAGGGHAGLDIIMVSGTSKVQHEERIFGSAKTDSEKRVGARHFTLLNSLWFTISAIMRQGCETAPRSGPTRIIAASWWFFSFVLVSSYTANLTAFLTRERLHSPMESLEDLVKQSEVRYGCVRSGSTQAFFKDSKHETYERMWHAMQDDLVASDAEGVARVENGGYAFLTESASIAYIVQRRCKLTHVGGLLDSKGYGIAMPQGSPYRGPLSSAILRLQESGKLQLLKQRWWSVREPAIRCSESSRSPGTDSAVELGLPKLGGVFVVLLAGLGISCLIAFAEFFCKARSARS